MTQGFFPKGSLAPLGLRDSPSCRCLSAEALAKVEATPAKKVNCKQLLFKYYI